MNCPHCNSLNTEDVDVCINCGAPLRQVDTSKNSHETPGIPSDFLDIPDPSPQYSETEPPGAPASEQVIEAQAVVTETPPKGDKSASAEKIGQTDATRPGRELAILLEILPGLFGILGLGWIYAGNKKIGVALLIGFLVWDLIALIATIVSGLSACFCTLPINILAVIVSVLMLNRFMQKSE